MKRMVCILLICSICLASVPAKAMALAAALVVGFIGVEITAVVCIVGNLSHVIDGERPGFVYLAGGYITGLINVVVGIFFLSQTSQSDTEWLKAGVALTVVGALDIGITIWANAQPKRPYRVSVGPIVMPDARGKAALGIGLQVVGW